jgi:hypothetical protein
MPFCTSCGTAHAHEARFCTACGNRLGDDRLGTSAAEGTVSIDTVLVTLDAWIEADRFVRVEELLGLLRSLSATHYTAQEFYRLVQFDAEQAARWKVRWLNSPASAPDLIAEQEMRCWEAAWQAHSETLIKTTGKTDLIETLDHQRQVVATARAIKVNTERVTDPAEQSRLERLGEDASSYTAPASARQRSR